MSMDAVKAIGEVVIEGMGIGDAQMVRFHMYEEIPPVGTKLYGPEALSQVRKQALLEAAEICDEMQQHWNDYKDTALLNDDIGLSLAASGEPRAARFLAERFRKLAEEE
jgi:hypothetical protein